MYSVGNGYLLNGGDGAAQTISSLANWLWMSLRVARSIYESAIRARYDTTGYVFSFGNGLMRSKSVGHVRLLEARPGGALEIQQNFLAESADLEAMVTAVETVIERAAAPANAHLFAGFAAPDRRLTRRETGDFIRDACSTFFHSCGTWPVAEEDEAVVDSRLAVRGLE